MFYTAFLLRTKRMCFRKKERKKTRKIKRASEHEAMLGLALKCLVYTHKQHRVVSLSKTVLKLKYLEETPGFKIPGGNDGFSPQLHRMC